jgi:hypothetical protein
MRWLRLRRDILTAHPVCQRCEEEGLISPATEVHHVIPCETALNLREMETLMFDPHNLLALCHRHHAEAHKTMGRDQTARRQRHAERLEKFRAKFLGD